MEYVNVIMILICANMEISNGFNFVKCTVEKIGECRLWAVAANLSK